MTTMKVRVTRANDAVPLAGAAQLASNPWTRFLGLMGHKALPVGGGLLLKPCSSVHTCFMRFPIDVLYLSRENEVVKIVPAMRPWRFSWGARGAHTVLELPATAAGSVAVGDVLALEPSGN